MAGLLNLVIGGALKGTGDAMVEQAKTARDAAIAALTEQNKRTDAATAQGYESANIGQQEAGANLRSDNQNATTLKTTAMNNTTSTTNTAAEISGRHADVATEQGGANTRSAAEISGRHADVATTTQAQKDVANIRGNASNYNATVRAAALSGGKPLTEGQAYMAARQAYADNLKASVDMTDGNGNSIPADRWIAAQASQLLQTSAARHQSASGPNYSGLDSSGMTGGGLTNPYGGGQQQQPTLQAAPQAQNIAAPGPAAAPVAATGIPSVVAPIGALDMLQKNPSLAPYFDQKYGQGSAAAALGK